MKYEIRLVGSGGQGIITAAVVLAEAAANVGLNVAQTQVYGPEARGSLCRSELIICDSKILFPKVERPDITVLLTQEACNKYSSSGSDKCSILTDSSLTVQTTAERIISIPIFTAAEKLFNRVNCVNMLTLGVLNHIWHIVPDEELIRAIKKYIPSTSWEDGILAYKTGIDLAANSEYVNRHLL